LGLGVWGKKGKGEGPKTEREVPKTVVGKTPSPEGKEKRPWSGSYVPGRGGGGGEKRKHEANTPFKKKLKKPRKVKGKARSWAGKNRPPGGEPKKKKKG